MLGEHTLAPRVGVDSAGIAIAVWRQVSGQIGSIFANYETPGSSWGTAEAIESSPEHAYSPELAVGKSGQVLAVWWASRHRSAGAAVPRAADAVFAGVVDRVTHIRWGCKGHSAFGAAIVEAGLPPAERIVLEYADTGYEVSIQINGEARIVSEMQELTGEEIGGVSVSVEPWSAHAGRLYLERVERSILQLRIGGHELFVDEIEGYAVLPALPCEIGAARCVGNDLEVCGYVPGATTTAAGWFAKDCAATGGRCFEAVDGPRCIEPALPSAGALFAAAGNYYHVKQRMKWQETYAYYDRSSESIKSSWEDWSDSPLVIPDKADVIAAIDDATTWLSHPTRNVDFLGQPSTALSPAGILGRGLLDSDVPHYLLPEEQAWRLYVWWVAHAIALDIAGELPWSLNDIGLPDWHNLAALFDGTELMWRGNFELSDHFGLGQVSHPLFYTPWGGSPAPPWGAYLGSTIVGTPRYTLRFLQQEGLIRPTPYETAVAILEWGRFRLRHLDGGAVRERTEFHWGVRHYPTIEMVVERTVRPTETTAYHWTLGCHGTTAFIRHLLRAVNIPARVLLTCRHAQLSIPSENVFLEHGDQVHNTLFRDSTCSAGHLLVDEPACLMRFGHTYNHDDDVYCDVIPDPIGAQVLPDSLATCE